MPRFAHFLALVGLLCVSRAESLSPHDKTLVIFLTSEAAVTPAISAEIKQEVDHLMQSAAIDVNWRDPVIDRTAVENDYSAVVRLRGSCHPPEPSVRFEHAVSGPFPLASSAVSDGVILPFGDIDCAALNAFLGPSLWKESVRVREFVYARAVARLMAHELYHVIEQTGVHGHAGITKPAFTVADLLGDHFEFTESAFTESLASPEAADSVSIDTAGK